MPKLDTKIRSIIATITASETKLRNNIQAFKAVAAVAVAAAAAAAAVADAAAAIAPAAVAGAALMTTAGLTSITNVVAWVDPSPVMLYPDKLGRESWDWEGQESAVLQMRNAREAGVVKSWCAAPPRDKTRSREGEVIVVVVVVVVVVVAVAVVGC